MVPILLYLNHRYILANPKFPLPAALRQLVPANTKNPWSPLLFLSGFDGRDQNGTALYKRHWNVSPGPCLVLYIVTELWTHRT